MKKKKKVKNFHLDILGAIIEGYIVVSIIAFFGGVLSADHKYTGCGIKTRIEYVFPAYRLGCWLNAPLEEK